MKILVFGAGLIGTTYAWQLQEAGCDVTLFVRRQRMVRYSHSGISVTYTDMRKTRKEEGHTVYRPAVVDRLEARQAFDLIIVAVRSNQWQDAIPYVAKYSGNADILFLGNMWDEWELAGKHLPAGRYFLGFPEIVSGGHIENGIDCYMFKNRHTWLGEPGGRETDRLRKTAAIFETAGLQPMVSLKIKDLLTTHYLFSAITPGLISKAGSARLFASNKTLVKQYVFALKEGMKVCRKRGFNPTAIFPSNRFFLPVFILVKLIRNNFTEETLAAMDAHMRYGATEKKKQYANVLHAGKKSKTSMPYWASFEKYMDFS